MIQRLGLQIPAEVGEFFNFKNYLCKLPIGNEFQLGNNSNVNEMEYLNSTVDFNKGTVKFHN